MRQLKQFMRNRKADMLWCGTCGCRTLQCRREANENCGCGEGSNPEPTPPTPIDYQAEALAAFLASDVYTNATDKDAAEAAAQTIIETAGDAGIEPFYDAIERGDTFEAYVEAEGLVVDETGTCDDTLIADDAAFTLYVSAMGAIDCKYLASSGGSLINEIALTAYLATLI